MAFSARLISRRLMSGSSILSGSVARTHRTTTPTSPPGKSAIQSSNIQKKSSPCLMLPDEGYSLYNLAQNRVLTLPQIPKGEFKDNLNFCGSSHGWIALFNPQTLDLFIYNPISFRRINLPPIHNLPNYPEDEERSVKKLILTCSPDEDKQNCRALIIYNCVSAVAFCSLQSNEWTPIGSTFLMGDVSGRMSRVERSYRDFAYSTRQNLFFGITDFWELETWDLSDPSSPVLIKMIKKERDDDDDDTHDHFFSPVSSLVVAEDDVILVTRYLIQSVARDGAYMDTTDYFRFPHMTVDFRIDVYDQEGDELVGLESLGDLAVFIGTCSDSFAVSVTKCPELKSNSIYFTDRYMETKDSDESSDLFGGHDIGIFSFESKTVSPCYYPNDRPSLGKIVPSPMWFLPRLSV